MDLAETFQDRRNQAMLGGSILFMLLFPIYFAMVPGLVGLDDSSSSELSGTWSVSFIEETFTQSENSGELGDGDTYDSTFILTEDMIGENRNVASADLTNMRRDDSSVSMLHVCFFRMAKKYKSSQKAV